MKKTNKKGFTLTELIIVIVIIGILAGVLIPSLSGYIKKAKKSAAEQDAQGMQAEFISKASNDMYSDLAAANYLIKSGNYYVVIEKGQLIDSSTNLTDFVASATAQTETDVNSGNLLEKLADKDGKKVFIYLDDVAIADARDDFKSFNLKYYVEK